MVLKPPRGIEIEPDRKGSGQPADKKRLPQKRKPSEKRNYLPAITLPNCMPEPKHQIRYSA